MAELLITDWNISDGNHVLNVTISGPLGVYGKYTAPRNKEGHRRSVGQWWPYGQDTFYSDDRLDGKASAILNDLVGCHPILGLICDQMWGIRSEVAGERRV